MGRSTAALLVSALTLFGTSVGAQKQQRNEADLALAKQYFQLGRTYYDQGLHEKALEAFQESYKHSGRPALLYNIARCHEFLGQVEPAIDHYERFLKESGKNNPTIKARIRNLKARLERDRRKTTPVVVPPVKPKPRPAPNVKPVVRQPEQVKTPPRPVKRVRAKPAPRPRAVQPAPPPVAQQSEQPSSWMKWTGWGLVGVGAASLITSFVFGARAASKASLMEDALACSTGEGPSGCPEPPGTAYEWSTVKQIEDDGKRFEVAQITTLVLGILAGGAGTTLILLAPKRRALSAARVAPMIGMRSFGVTSSIEF